MRRTILLSLLPLFVVVESPGGELELDWLQDIPPPLQSSLAITLGVDDADGWSRQLDLGLAAPLDTRFDLSLGESRVESDEAQLQTDFHALSFSTNPLAEMSFSLGYEDWGDDDALTIETRWFGLGLNLGDFSITLMPQQRDIRLQVLQWFQRYIPYVDLESRDIGLSLSYFGPESWVFSAVYFKYDYSEDISRLGDDYRVIFIFPLNALDLASGLDEYRYSLGVGRLIDDISIDLDWTRSRSAVDQNYASVISLSADFPLSDEISLSLMGGMQEVDYSEDQILFANLGLTLYW
ncbi:MAG: hypothetical protein ABW080_06975 [Candidatus Thiodiazotropha sp.]